MSRRATGEDCPELRPAGAVVRQSAPDSVKTRSPRLAEFDRVAVGLCGVLQATQHEESDVGM